MREDYFWVLSCWTTRSTISCSCEHKSSCMVVRLTGMSGEAEAWGEV